MKRYVSFIVAAALITGAVQIPAISNLSGITVEAASVISSQPLSTSVTQGSNAYFTVNAIGNNLTYQWQYKTSSGAAWQNSTKGNPNTATLTVEGTSMRNGFQYRCIVKSDGNEYISNAATLKVYQTAPSVTVTSPSNATVNLNQNAYFTVNTSLKGQKFQWQWSSNGGTTWTDSKKGNPTTQTLTVVAEELRDGFQYRCKIINPANNSYRYSEKAKLTINKNTSTSTSTLKITEQPENQSIVEGQKAYFSVEAVGEGNLNYQWQWTSGSSWSDSTKGNPTTPTLKVDGEMFRNGFKYRCKITDKNGVTKYSDVAVLTVSKAIQINTQPANNAVNENEKAYFTVKASGNDLHYQWQYKTSANSGWNNSTKGNPTTDTLTVEGTRARDGFQYRCIITDKYNNKITSEACQLKVHYVTFTTNPPASVTALDGEDVKIDVYAKGEGTSFQWLYKNGSNGTWKEMTSDMTLYYRKSHFQFTMSSAFDNVWIKCRVTDKYGNTAESTETKLNYFVFKFKEQPQKSYPTSNMTDSFSFTIDTNRACNFQYQWQESSNNGYTWVDSTREHANDPVLSFKRSTGDDTKLFRVKVKDLNTGYEIISDSAYVMTDLKIYRQPVNVFTDKIHGEVTMSIGVTGSNVNYRWEYSYNGKDWTQATGKGRNTDTMTIECGPTSAGTKNYYRCVVTDRNTSLTSNVITATCTASYN